MKTYFKQLTTVYTTTKVVDIKSPVFAISHVIIIVLIWCAFLSSMSLDLRKIYQKRCPVRGVVLTKVKGFASTENLTDEELGVQNPHLYRRTWDPADLVYPASGEGETGSFAIVTNLIITPNQTLGTCADDHVIAKCETDADCEQGYWSPATQGVHTGNCYENEAACEIRGWCPIEKDKNKLPRAGKRALLEDVENFTVLLKNTVDFPGCSKPQARNMPNYVGLEYLRKCRYNRFTDPLCPIFRIGYIVEKAGANFTSASIRGGVFRIKVKWDCDLDFGKTLEDCRPKYEFMRVDEKEGTSEFFSGFNFRTAEYFADNRRMLRKQFALKIIIDLEGEGRTFEFFAFILNIGASIGLFSVATLVCDSLLDIMERLKKFHRCIIKDNAQDDPVVTRYYEDDGSAPPPEEVFTTETIGNVNTGNSKVNMRHEYHVNRAFSDSRNSLGNASFKSISE